MEVTALCVRLLVNVLLLLAAQHLNSYCVHAADEAFPQIDPNRLQFFEYESVSFNCASLDGPTEWRVMTKTPSNAARWETSGGSLNIVLAFVSHSGEYWCQDGDGKRSRSLNITVTAGAVILESPALPVMEGQTVTLRCRQQGSSSNLPADFYKDGRFSKTGYSGEMIIHNVSTSDEGLYKCSTSGSGGDSPESRLAVRDTTPEHHQEPPPPPPPPPPGSSGLSAVVTTLCVAALLLLLVGLLRRHKVGCFSSKIPTTGSDPACAPALVPDPNMEIYANVPTHKKKRVSEPARVRDPNMDVYANITNTTKHKKKKVPGRANVADAKGRRDNSLNIEMYNDQTQH